jgi:hypothetical protein
MSNFNHAETPPVVWTVPHAGVNAFVICEVCAYCVIRHPSAFAEIDGLVRRW